MITFESVKAECEELTNRINEFEKEAMAKLNELNKETEAFLKEVL